MLDEKAPIHNQPKHVAHACDITGVVLAGGLGRRMGGINKGLQMLRGQPMVHWVCQRLQPQVGKLLINANQDLTQYQALGYPVIGDQFAGFAGPLAGLHAALSVADTPWVVTAPCDTPFLPENLVRRLWHSAQVAEADLAVARTGDQVHPVFCLCRTRLVQHLNDYLTAGERRFAGWYATLRAVEANFDDQAAAFANINTREELLRHEP